MNPQKQKTSVGLPYESERKGTSSPSFSSATPYASNSSTSNNNSEPDLRSLDQSMPSSYSSYASLLVPSSGMATYIQYGVIIIIISLLGLNVFGLLETIIGNATDLIRPLAAFFGYNIGEVIKGAVSTSATGAKGIVDVASGTITGGVDILEKGLNLKNRNNRNKIDNSFLDQSVPNNEKPEESPEPDESGSRTQTKSTGKSGYCYIGEDRGFRNCIEVGENDKCMSGDIFPSQEICINPNLRE